MLQEWQHAMAEEIAALEWTDTWDLMPYSPRVRSLVSGSIRLRLALMVLLSAIRLVSLLMVFNRSKVVIMIRLLLMLLIWPLFALFLLWLLFESGPSLSLMWRMHFLNCEMRKDVYLRPPLGYSIPGSMVCHLRWSLYGLKQASRAWF
jgi:hypothetical protein